MYEVQKALPVMALRVVGAGLPRTGTASLKEALELLLGGKCLHMSELPGHPFELGEGWSGALAGQAPNWERLFAGYIAAVDWPASLFWRELSIAYPDALVLLSLRDTAEIWWQSAEATILPVARRALVPDWSGGRDLLTLLEKFTGTAQWDDPATLMTAYERHNAAVRVTIPRERLLEWRAEEGWVPICHALGMPIPDQPFPRTNKRDAWG
jgi:sulfotransferase family protein